MKVLVATVKPFAPIAIRQIRGVIEAAGMELALLENYSNESELINAVSDADALIVRSDLVDSKVLDAAPNLKIVVRAGAGYDNLDIEACTSHKVVAMNTPGQNSNAVAELVFLLTLFQIRKGFAGKTGRELRTKTLGLHGFGNVGKYVADIAKGFGMDIYSFDPFVSERIMKNYGAKQCIHLDEMYRKCQYVSLHMPSNERTNRTITYELMSSMPPDALLINCARKEIIDEEALLKVFEERKDFCYVADVEPDCRKILEERFSGRFTFTSKKMGAQTEEANINAGVAAARQIADFFKTGNQKYRINQF